MLRLIVLSSVVLVCTFGAVIPKGLIALWEARIVGGTATTIEEYPYIISLKYYGGHRCGGSIITEKHFVTAAHCVYGANKDGLQVVAGTTYRTSGGISKNVSSYNYHEQYNSTSIDNDVAVVITETGYDFSKTIQPIQLAVTDPEPGAKGICIGWGTLQEGGPSPNQLQFVEVSIVSLAACRAAYGSSRITNSMMCAGEPEGGKDACQGDSGGPLTVYGYLVGIVSWGYGCARPGFPGVYANAVYFDSWIKSNIS